MAAQNLKTMGKMVRDVSRAVERGHRSLSRSCRVDSGPRCPRQSTRDSDNFKRDADNLINKKPLTSILANPPRCKVPDLKAAYRFENLWEQTSAEKNDNLNRYWLEWPELKRLPKKVRREEQADVVPKVAKPSRRHGMADFCGAKTEPKKASSLENVRKYVEGRRSKKTLQSETICTPTPIYSECVKQLAKYNRTSACRSLYIPQVNEYGIKQKRHKRT